MLLKKYFGKQCYPQFVRMTDNEEELDFSEGNMVYHEKYGRGVIEKIMKFIVEKPQNFPKTPYQPTQERNMKEKQCLVSN